MREVIKNLYTQHTGYTGHSGQSPPFIFYFYPPIGTQQNTPILCETGNE
jgi:hypothetical protein